jgi:hypothetical protein
MNVAEPRIIPFSTVAASRPRRAVIVTSYVTGAPDGQNLGSPGYSYDFVVRLFAPLIEQWGELFVTPRDEVDKAVAEARAKGFEPIHLSFLPIQDVRLAEDAPNVVVPAWEFPDIPDHVFDDKPENDWVRMASQCDLVIVGGPFTMEAFRRSAVRTPIRIVQVPTAEEYFRVPHWNPEGCATLNFAGHTFDGPEPIAEPGAEECEEGAPVGNSRSQRCGDDDSLFGKGAACVFQGAARTLYRRSLARILPKRLHYVLRRAVHAGLNAWRETGRQGLSALADASEAPLNLSGVVYTSIFNPQDSRKNWEDLITGFLCAMKDRDDATLVLKLITNQARAADRLVTFYRRTGIPHRCKVVFVPGFLDEQQLLELAEATTFYITTTRAEGNCLPLLNYLAAGRPGISPCHTAISDYFGNDVGFVVESHPEPAAFPHDRQLRKTTSWHRLVWPSLFDAICRSYQMAKNDHSSYDRLARRAREKMSGWNSMQVVGPRLHEALGSVLPNSSAEVKTLATRLQNIAA